MTIDEQVIEELRRIARHELEYEGAIDPTHSLQADLRLDSMAVLVIAVGLENRFQVCLNEQDAGAIETVADLVALVRRRIEERGS